MSRVDSLNSGIPPSVFHIALLRRMLQHCKLRLLPSICRPLLLFCSAGGPTQTTPMSGFLVCAAQPSAQPHFHSTPSLLHRPTSPSHNYTVQIDFNLTIPQLFPLTLSDITCQYRPFALLPVPLLDSRRTVPFIHPAIHRPTPHLTSIESNTPEFDDKSTFPSAHCTTTCQYHLSHPFRLPS